MYVQGKYFINEIENIQPHTCFHNLIYPRLLQFNYLIAKSVIFPQIFLFFVYGFYFQQLVFLFSSDSNLFNHRNLYTGITVVKEEVFMKLTFCVFVWEGMGRGNKSSY